MPDRASHFAGIESELAHIAQSQLFFIGGAPRSGTTWLQQILNAHPQVSCGGEGLFEKELAVPLDGLIAARGRALEAKNSRVFKHSGGYPPPQAEDGDFLLRTAILLALRRQGADARCVAVGEKTPENVFFFPRLAQLFPGAKFIGIARDPRDVLTSAWHFFHRPVFPGPVFPGPVFPGPVFPGSVAGADERAAKIAFVRMALPSIAQGARAMIALVEQQPASCMIVTFEALCQTPAAAVPRLFRFLGASEAADLVADCLAQTSFSQAAGGRAKGVAENGAFHRKGVVGDWMSTLTAEMNEMILRELDWMFPYFGWEA